MTRGMERIINKGDEWTSLAVQCLRLHTLPVQGARIQSLVGKMRSHMPYGRTKKKKKLNKGDEGGAELGRQTGVCPNEKE